MVDPEVACRDRDIFPLPRPPVRGAASATAADPALRRYRRRSRWISPLIATSTRTASRSQGERPGIPNS